MRIPSPLRQAFALVAPCLLAIGIWFGQRPSTAQPSPAVTFANLSTNSFRVTNAIVTVRAVGVQQGTNVFITNLFVTNLVVNEINISSNLFVTNIFVTNLFAVTENVTNLYVTNIFNTFLVTSNIVAGNINGTTNTLAMFTPDSFSVGDSIVTQPDTNRIVVNGGGTGYVQLSGEDAGEEIIFGTGATNVLYRSASQLIYTNGAVSGNGVTFKVINGAGTVAVFGVDQDSHGLVQSDTGKFFRIEPNAGAQTFTYSSVGHYPNSLLTLGLPERPWGTFYLGGFNDTSTTTNYSRLVVSHTGTNGSIIFDSQSSGTAGPPRPFYFNLGGTNQARIYYGSGNNRPGLYLIDSFGSDFPAVVRDVDLDQFLVGNAAVRILYGATEKSVAMGADLTIGDQLSTFTTAAVLGVFSGPTNLFSVLADHRVHFEGVTKAQKTAMSPNEGDVVFQTDNTPGLRVYQSGAWRMVSTAVDP